MAYQGNLEFEGSLLETHGKGANRTCCVPVIEISKESADDTWPAVIGAIRGATYVALDLVSCKQNKKRNVVDVRVLNALYCVVVFHF